MNANAPRVQDAMPELPEETIEQIREAYRRISDAGGFGSIRLHVRRAGSKKPKLVLSIEIEWPSHAEAPSVEQLTIEPRSEQKLK